MAKKIIDKTAEIAKKEGVKQRQSYKFVSKNLVRTSNAKSPRAFKKAKKARKKIKTIAGRVVREIKRKLTPKQLDKHKETIEIYERVLEQKRTDKDKIYSLHALEVACIAKGKAHKKYEFGSKVSFATTQKSNVIVGAVNFKGNPHDDKTLEATLEQQERMTKTRAKNAYVDRGYRRKWIGETKINAPDNGKGKTPYEKAKARKSFRRRAAIEPIIGHAKENYGMGRNYLKGEVGDAINAMLAASAFNFKSWMRKATADVIFVLIYIKEKWQEITIQLKLVPSF